MRRAGAGCSPISPWLLSTHDQTGGPPPRPPAGARAPPPPPGGRAGTNPALGAGCRRWARRRLHADPPRTRLRAAGMDTMFPEDHPTLDAALRLGLAFLLVLPLGWDREQRSRSAGLRTYPLLSVCVCGFLLLARTAARGASDEADVFYGVLTGIGFVGSGAIVKSPESAHGMSTAITLWLTGAIG